MVHMEKIIINNITIKGCHSKKCQFFVNANKNLALTLATNVQVFLWNSSAKKPKIQTSLLPFCTVFSNKAAIL